MKIEENFCKEHFFGGKIISFRKQMIKKESVRNM